MLTGALYTHSWTKGRHNQPINRLWMLSLSTSFMARWQASRSGNMLRLLIVRRNFFGWVMVPDLLLPAKWTNHVPQLSLPPAHTPSQHANSPTKARRTETRNRREGGHSRGDRHHRPSHETAQHLQAPARSNKGARVPADLQLMQWEARCSQMR